MLVYAPIVFASRLEKSQPPSAADFSLMKNLLSPQHQKEDSSPPKIGQTCTTVYVYASIVFIYLFIFYC